uniref:Uncharacterized protein n=1 Tax=Schlesneria paludicola TaxID=360056 RepID=A0A7C2P498_9PLAN
MTTAVAAPAETEADLVARAQASISQCQWEVGECAALWTRRFARGRTDADFAQLIGLSPDQVYQRRRVWETFSDARTSFPALRWSHFYAALNWDDAAECLQWAQDIGATVAEMRAWRRAQRGEDLSEPSADAVDWMASEAVAVRVPDDGEAASQGGLSGARTGVVAPVAAGVARAAEGGDGYAPFHEGAITPPSTEAPAKERPAPTVEQLVRRMTTAIERCVAAIDAPFKKHFADVPAKDRRRFLKAIEQLADKTAGLD